MSLRKSIGLLGVLLCFHSESKAQTKPTEYFSPAWSADEKTLAFEVVRDGRDYAIGVVRVDGTGRKDLTTGDHRDSGPFFSKDGKRLIFTSDRAGHVEVYAMNTNGTNPIRLTNTRDGSYYPGSFSPDQKQIAFHARPAGYTGGNLLYVASVGARGMRPLTDSAITIMDPRWSPDGKRILFSARPVSAQDWIKLTPAERDGFLKRTELYTIHPDGSGLTRLTTNEVRETQATWSSDGKSVMYMSKDGDAWALHRIQADGTKDIRLGEAPDGSVASPSGRFVAFAKHGPGVEGIYIRDMRTGVDRLVTEGK